MNITVIGAAGRLGCRVVEEASRRGHKVAGLARHPERLARPELLCNIAAGDGRDRDTAARAVAEADAVVITVAGGTGKDPRQAADVTRTVITAMREHGVGRLVITSAYPIVATRPMAVMWVLRRVLATPYADTAEAERITAASSLDWTIVRLNRLTDHRPVGPPHISTGLLDRPTGLSRTDAATLLVDLAETRDHAREALNVRGHDQSRQGPRRGYSP
jgi:putative NADH-flavin reductase